MGLLSRAWNAAGPVQTVLLAILVCNIVSAAVYVVGLICLLSARSHLRQRNDARRRTILRELGIFEREEDEPRPIVGFFHPYCNAGGGGERVLWAAIACMQRDDPRLITVVYTGDVDASKEAILARAQERFNISLDASSIAFVYLRRRRWIEATTWRRFTMFGQSIGSVVLAHEAMSRLIPDFYIDSMGYAFSFPVVAWLASVPAAGYVHYPTISSSMLQRVSGREAGHTNSSAVSSSSVLSSVKYAYYLIFMELYSIALRQASVLMVNSTWTHGHVQRLLSPITQRDEHEAEDRKPVDPEQATRLRASIVYPPCDTASLSKLPLDGRQRVIFSLAQFRPEKEQALQLRALAALFAARPDMRDGSARVSLVMAGSVRDEADEARLDGLRALAAELNVADHVEFVANASWTDLQAHFARASIGLSTMVDEHFGINVVELMAAGLIPLTHASGGPLLDIVVPYEGEPTGFHARDAQDFAAKLEAILDLSEATQLAFRWRARSLAVERFSTARFEAGWLAAWHALRDQ